MARELVWLENSTFAAWGCSACYFIVPNTSPATSGKPSREVIAAFNRHECAKFPQPPSPKTQVPAKGHRARS